MNNYYNNYKNTKNDRDFVFEEVLEYFKSKPIKILEIGCARSLGATAKAGDGHSTLFFADYIFKKGGELTVVDIDEGCLNNCKVITSDFSDLINYQLGDGFDFISDDFDLIYLDGGDDNNEMVKQFEKCNRKKSIILCDDFNQGGKCDILKEKHKDYQLFQVNQTHQMAVYLKQK